MVSKIVTVMVVVMTVSGQKHSDSDIAGCNCGVRKDDSILTTKISGGTEANVNEFPWAALLKIKKSGSEPMRCGGTLINEK